MTDTSVSAALGLIGYAKRIDDPSARPPPPNSPPPAWTATTSNPCSG